jgi:hypothetical protein
MYTKFFPAIFFPVFFPVLFKKKNIPTQNPKRNHQQVRLTLCSIYMIAHVIIQTVRDCDRSSGLTAKGVRCSRRTCKLDRVVFNRAIQVCIDSSSRAAAAAESA